MELAHHPHHRLHIFDRRIGHDAVAKIEDVSGTPAGRAQNFLHALLQYLERSKQGNGVEIALHRMTVPNGAPALVQRLPPVEPDHVGAGFTPWRPSRPAVSTPK